MSQEALGIEASVSVMTVKRFEASKEIAGTLNSLRKIEEALKQAGIIFIDAGPDGGPGVRLAK
jgi:hypothetical protein